MPHDLDEVDIAILNSLMDDGRKSFRQIGREIKITTPTVQARYKRLVNLGFIKSISPVLDLSKLDKKSKNQIKHADQKTTKTSKLGTNHKINVTCDYCAGPTIGKPQVLKFGQFERFFCCNSCKTLYKEKYRGKIESLENPEM